MGQRLKRRRNSRLQLDQRGSDSAVSYNHPIPTSKGLHWLYVIPWSNMRPNLLFTEVMTQDSLLKRLGEISVQGTWENYRFHHTMTQLILGVLPHTRWRGQRRWILVAPHVLFLQNGSAWGLLYWTQDSVLLKRVIQEMIILNYGSENDLIEPHADSLFESLNLITLPFIWKFFHPDWKFLWPQHDMCLLRLARGKFRPKFVDGQLKKRLLPSSRNNFLIGFFDLDCLPSNWISSEVIKREQILWKMVSSIRFSDQT